LSIRLKKNRRFLAADFLLKIEKAGENTQFKKKKRIRRGEISPPLRGARKERRVPPASGDTRRPRNGVVV
jgi:hypothetical protein